MVEGSFKKGRQVDDIVTDRRFSWVDMRTLERWCDSWWWWGGHPPKKTKCKSSKISDETGKVTSEALKENPELHLCELRSQIKREIGETIDKTTLHGCINMELKLSYKVLSERAKQASKAEERSNISGNSARTQQNLVDAPSFC